MSQETEQRQADSLTEMKFEYAWRYFSFHARQRVTMFNFFLVGSGVLGNAYALLARAQMDWEAGVVAIIGILVSLISIGLDVRNNQLVDLGEEALKRVERDHLISANEALPEYAILSFEDDRGEPLWIRKHKGLIRSLEAVVGLVFLGATFYSFGTAVIGWFCN